MKSHLLRFGFLAVCLLPLPSEAAELTDVLTSFDFDEGNPFDIKLEIKYEFSSETAELLRETPDASVDPIELVLGNRLAYERTRHTMRFGLGVGLYKELEFRLDLPLVLGDESSLDFHPSLPVGGERGQIKDIDPKDQPWNNDADSKARTLFDVPFKGPNRSGLGDVGIGLRWAPRHRNRDPQYASWVVGAMLRMPSANVKRAGNTDVGEGLLQVEINTAISRRVTWFFEPFFDLHGVVKVPSSSSLFQEADESTQTLEQPGNTLGLTLGAEFIPWEANGGKQKVSLELGVGLDYVFEGREYTELFDALGTSPCSTSNGCYSATYSAQMEGYEQAIANLKKKVGSTSDTTLKATYQKQLDDKKAAYESAKQGGNFPASDGITDVEHYGMYSFFASLMARPVEYFQFGLAFKLAAVQPHFITFADAGVDLDGDGSVVGENSEGINEYNPVYLEELDQIGHRFKTSNKIIWNLMFNLTGRY